MQSLRTETEARMGDLLPLAVAPVRGNDSSLRGHLIKLKRGDEIFTEGEDAVHVYRLVTGAVRLCKSMMDGRRQIAEFAAPGNMIGLDGYSTYTLTAEAITDVQLVRYASRMIDDLSRAEIGVAHMLQGMAFSRLKAAQAQMVLLGRKNAHERVATFLLDLGKRNDAHEGGLQINLPMTRYDIADYLGLTFETVSRELAALRRKGIIGMDGAQSVRILDKARLESLTE